jgi:hypothetical protein
MDLMLDVLSSNIFNNSLKQEEAGLSLTISILC